MFCPRRARPHGIHYDDALCSELGFWKHRRTNAHGQYVPVGGLAYFVSPPRSMQEVVTDPFHSVIYVVFILASCAMFSVVWIEVKREGESDSIVHSEIS